MYIGVIYQELSKTEQTDQNTHSSHLLLHFLLVFMWADMVCLWAGEYQESYLGATVLLENENTENAMNWGGSKAENKKN
jgi:hypothetical protein